MSTFVPGIDLSRRLHDEVVRPIIEARLPGLAYAAGLLGRGSEVLGFDDQMSTDHDGGPRLLLFLGERDVEAGAGDVVRGAMPPTHDGRPVELEVHNLRGWFRDELALDVAREIEVADWLTLPEHVLATVVAGEVFHDDVGLGEVRDRLAWYPRDVWLYLLATGWWRIHPEANLVGRAGHVGDDLGSALIGSRLVTEMMRLCFLMERRYPPYPKWFGTAFARLDNGPDLMPALTAVVRAENWQARQAALGEAYRRLASVHDRLGLTEAVPLETVRMWDRPFEVPWADFPGLLHAEIRDPQVLAVAEQFPLGPVDRFRELLSPPRNRRRLRRVLDADEIRPPRSPGAAG
ncbi:DUF4037 domain-containing protein [Nocardioides taihuensis]|uniref:DUF4037 domain-containing protein n=1 Tax=Nocardioides taihuensis TaxID=1835606 RepID=A0ABW0BQ61_9ACTN